MFLAWGVMLAWETVMQTNWETWRCLNTQHTQLQQL